MSWRRLGRSLSTRSLRTSKLGALERAHDASQIDEPTLQTDANGCSRWLASRLHGFEKAAPKQRYRRFDATGGTVQIQENGITVAFDRRNHNPIHCEAALDRKPIPNPRLGKQDLAFTFR